MTIAMLASFMVVGSPVTAAGGPLTPSINEWEGVVLPSTVPDSDVDLIEQAKDGTIFISVFFDTDPDGAGPLLADTWAMYKSTNGYTWTLTNVFNQDTRITAIEPSADYANDKTVYVAIDTSADSFTTIFKCTNGAAVGTPYTEMGRISAGEHGTTPASYVYYMDSYFDGTDVWLLVATDIDVFAIPDDGRLTTYWTDMDLSETLGDEYADGSEDLSLGYDLWDFPGVDVFMAKFAPDYASSGVIWAVYYDEFESTYIDTVLGAGASDSNGYGIIARDSGSTLWGQRITPVIIEDTVTPGNAANEFCDIEFSAAYNSASAPEIYAALSFAGVHTPGAGTLADDDLYRIECGFWGAAGNYTQFDVDPTDRVDFCSLEVYGNVIIAGTYEAGAVDGTATEVWYSTNDGTSWAMASKNPTGELDSTCRVLISKFGTTVGLAFAATSGTQSAVSISDDNGDTWMQIGFIDDVITTIDDIAFNPTSKAALMITTNAGGISSLWKVADVTVLVPFWQRTLCEDFSTTIDEFDMVEYSNDGVAIMLYDDTDDVIYRSTNDTRTFGNWRNTASWGTINAWIVPNSSTVYAAATGFWSTALVGSRLSTETLISIAMSGDSLVVGNDDGGAFASINKGNTWGTEIVCGGADVDVYVAFDALHATNKLFYYATSAGVVGKVLLDGNNQSLAPNSNVVLRDGDDQDGTKDACPGTSFTDIIVAPDNALYVLGSTGSSSSTGAASIISGTLDMLGSDSGSTADEVDITSAYFDMSALTVISGTFVDAETLTIYAADVTADSSSIVSGRVYVEGDTSGAMGYFDFVLYGTGSLFTATLADGEDVQVAVGDEDLTIDVAATSVSGDTCMYRLLLGQADNNWENPACTALDAMSGLWYSAGSNILWTIADSDTLFAFEDFLSGKTMGVVAVEINANPENEFKQVRVSWTHMNEDTSASAEDGTSYLISYSWTVGTTTFTYYEVAVAPASVAAGAQLSKVLTYLEASTEYTIKVRVMDDDPIQSRWSDAVKVTTGAYLYSPLPISPVQGQPQAATTSLNPTFTWGVVVTAVSYEFQLSDSATFATLIDSQTLAVTGYTYLGDGLAYDTDYYWRVRAVAADGTKSTWSSYSIIDLFGYYTKTGAPTSFHTMVDPDEYADEFTVTQTVPTITITNTQTNPTYTIPVPEFTVTVPAGTTNVTTQTLTVTIPEDETPVYIWAIVAIGALLTIAVIILIIRTRRVV
jgi:hypothetical protein